MTREEAVETLENHTQYFVPVQDLGALNMAIAALRPVSRERVEKVWRGEWKRDKWPSGTHRIICNRCGEWNGKTTNFCSYCGAPMTDEAVEMVMERLEALKDGPEQ